MTPEQRKARITEAISVMIQMFPRASYETTDGWGLVLDSYASALRGVPIDIIEEYARAFSEGRVDGHDGKFRPAPAEFARYCRRKVQRQSELQRMQDRRAQQLLPTPDMPPESERRKHVAAQLGYNPRRGKAYKKPKPESLITPQMREEEIKERARLTELGQGHYKIGVIMELRSCGFDEAQEWYDKNVR